MTLIVPCLVILYLILLVSITVGAISFQKKIKYNGQATKGISVVIAARNEVENIENVINSILSQDYPSQCFEIIVVNDHSNDDTFKAIPTSPLVTKISLPNTLFGKKAALKAGVSMAKFPYVAFTDADCIAPSTWLKAYDSIIFSSSPALIVGPVCLKHTNTLLSAFQHWEFRALQVVTFGSAAARFPMLCNGANLCFRKEDYEQANLKEELTPSGDDVFFLHSLLQLKKKVEFIMSRDLLVRTNPENSINSMLQQKLRWASKSKYITNKWTIAVGLLTFCTNLAIVGFSVYTVAVGHGYTIAVSIWITKICAEALLVYLPGKKVYGAFPRIRTFISSALLMPFYATFVALASLFLNFTWKQRTQR